MKIAALAVAGLVTFASAPAFAQYAYPNPYAPRPVVPVGPMPADGVFQMVRQMGLEPLGRPMRNGPYLVQRASDYYGRPMRVTVDAARAQVVSVEPTGGPPPGVYGGPYAATGPWHGPYRPYRMSPADDEIDYATPGSIMAPHAQPPRAGLPNGTVMTPPVGAPHVQQPHPAAKSKSAAITPARPPVPRKRPAVAPQETAGSVEPLKPQPVPNAAPQEKAPVSAAPAAKPDMPPVAPLD